jgi:hypothetical protein
MGTLAVVPEVPIGETGPERRLGDISGQRGRGRELRSPDAELISAAREAWPRVLAHAKREFSVGRPGFDCASFDAPIWERVLRSVSKLTLELVQESRSDHVV